MNERPPSWGWQQTFRAPPPPRPRPGVDAATGRVPAAPGKAPSDSRNASGESPRGTNSTTSLNTRSATNIDSSAAVPPILDNDDWEDSPTGQSNIGTNAHREPTVTATVEDNDWDETLPKPSEHITRCVTFDASGSQVDRPKATTARATAEEPQLSSQRTANSLTHRPNTYICQQRAATASVERPDQQTNMAQRRGQPPPRNRISDPPATAACRTTWSRPAQQRPQPQYPDINEALARATAVQEAVIDHWDEDYTSATSSANADNARRPTDRKPTTQNLSAKMHKKILNRAAPIYLDPYGWGEQPVEEDYHVDPVEDSFADLPIVSFFDDQRLEVVVEDVRGPNQLLVRLQDHVESFEQMRKGLDERYKKAYFKWYGSDKTLEAEQERLVELLKQHQCVYCVEYRADLVRARRVQVQSLEKRGPTWYEKMNPRHNDPEKMIGAKVVAVDYAEEYTVNHLKYLYWLDKRFATEPVSAFLVKVANNGEQDFGILKELAKFNADNTDEGARAALVDLFKEYSCTIIMPGEIQDENFEGFVCHLYLIPTPRKK